MAAVRDGVGFVAKRWGENWGHEWGESWGHEMWSATVLVTPRDCWTVGLNSKMKASCMTLLVARHGWRKMVEGGNKEL